MATSGTHDDIAMTSDFLDMSISSKQPKGTAFTTATFQQGINVSVESDEKPCEVTSFVFLPGKLVVCDGGNSKIKVFDVSLSFPFLYEYKLDNKPFDIDYDRNKSAVASSPEGKCLMVLLLQTGDMKELKRIDTEYQCYGVCVYDKNIYCVISDQVGSEMFSQVRVYSLSGVLKRRIEYLSYGNVEFDCMRYIAVNDDDDDSNLYATDVYNGVVVFSTSGVVRFATHQCPLRGAQVIAVDESGQIYVCNYESNKLLKLNADGTDINELLSNSMRCVKAQYVRIYGRILFLSRRESNTISIYVLS